MLSNKEIVAGNTPPEIPAPHNWRDLAVLGLGVLFVVACFNMLAGWYLKDHTLNRGYWIVSQKGKLISSLQMRDYWLIVGDSSGNFGIVPELLDKQLGTKSVNLCTIADMLTMDDFFMVDAYINQHGPPAGVLMVHAYDAWPRQGEIGAFARSHWPVEKISTFLDLDGFDRLELLIRRYFPLFSESTTLTKMSLMPRTAFFRKGLPFTIYPDGYMPLLSASPGVDGDARFHLRRIKEIAPEISIPNQAGLQALADLAERYKFNVYMVNSPVYERLRQHQNFVNYFQTIQTKLLNIANRHQRLHMLPFGEDLTFSAKQMENVDHVIFSAAETYTAQVAARIQALTLHKEKMQQ